MKSSKNLKILERLADEAVAYELEFGVPTKESRAAAQRYGTAVQDRLAAMRRADVARAPVSTERPQVRAALLGLARDGLLDWLSRITQSAPSLAFLYQDLTHVTDDDLRTMIEDAERALEVDRDPT